MPANPEMSVWAGRDDTAAEGRQARRWHQVMKSWSAECSPDMCCWGLRAMKGQAQSGQAGAAEAPQALRRALANLAWHTMSRCTMRVMYIAMGRRWKGATANG